MVITYIRCKIMYLFTKQNFKYSFLQKTELLCKLFSRRCQVLKIYYIDYVKLLKSVIM